MTPPCERHAVHRRRHAVLANAVVNETAGGIVRRVRAHAFRPRIVGAGEIRRSADHFRNFGGERFECEFRRRARRDVLWRGDNLILHGFHRRRELVLRNLTFHAALEFGAATAMHGGDVAASMHYAPTRRAIRPRAIAPACRLGFRTVPTSSRVFRVRP